VKTFSNPGQKAAWSCFLNVVKQLFGDEKSTQIVGSFEKGSAIAVCGDKSVRFNVKFPSVEVSDDGRLHNGAFGVPAVQKWHSSGHLAFVERFYYGRRDDSIDGPAIEGFYPGGSKSLIAHYVAGVETDALDGSPARCEFYPDGKPRLAEFKNAGFLHNPMVTEQGSAVPAVQEWDNDGFLIRADHYHAGVLLEGPAAPVACAAKDAEDFDLAGPSLSYVSSRERSQRLGLAA